MEWTKGYPTEPGGYLLANERAQVVLASVDWRHGRAVVTSTGWSGGMIERPMADISAQCFWFGPLPEPPPEANPPSDAAGA